MRNLPGSGTPFVTVDIATDHDEVRFNAIRNNPVIGIEVDFAEREIAFDRDVHLAEHVMIRCVVAQGRNGEFAKLRSGSCEETAVVCGIGMVDRAQQLKVKPVEPAHIVDRQLAYCTMVEQFLQCGVAFDHSIFQS